MSDAIISPTSFSDDIASLCSEIRKLAQVKMTVRQSAAEIKSRLSRSLEHTLSLPAIGIGDGEEERPVLQELHASAFDHETIQDLKYHEEADEVYFVVEGKLTIIWKANTAPQSVDSLQLNASDSCWAFIPKRYCLVVANPDAGKFLAIAFKTEPDGKGRGKVLGRDCPFFKNRSCGIRGQCEHLQSNREDFFEEASESRYRNGRRATAILHALADEMTMLHPSGANSS